ncbi:extracellular nuclease [Marinobacter santoriniensis NKSG1]|uniref:Extracellular nuclease n=1 Tax=Marinobacter santoriniensis NKSG1 TaxID=1288826 RepID=M7DAH8_9GAMM|nr:ExeM/NucH family extracellular endonuclease [Marinobacter santoriniensis]EMP54667.1 extracellular nuclease [Marinobacter santoriniensis NKSG1]
MLFFRALLAACLIFPGTSSALAATPPCGDRFTPIHAVQGSGARSPLEGKLVTVEGILTLDSRNPGEFQGFYLQQADNETDDDPDTSEALFVYTRRSAGSPGKRLRVTGRVREFHGLTELADINSLRVCQDAPMPRPVTLSAQDPGRFEAFENMRVDVPAAMTVLDTRNLARYGEVTLGSTDTIVPTEYLPPGPSAARKLASIHNGQLVLDDGRAVRQPRPIPWLGDPGHGRATLRSGDTLQDLGGILDFRFKRWRLQPIGTPNLARTNPRYPPPARPPGEKTVRVVALNLNNFFNGDGQGGGFPTARGARSESELQKQQKRLVTALGQSDGDILAVTELENDGYGANSAINQLGHALGPAWDFVRTPGRDGSDAIRTALLYRADRVVPTGRPQRLTSGPFRDWGRPPVTQSFRRLGGQPSVRIVVVHFKSKSCRHAEGADRDQNDGQGCFAHRRTREAKAVTAWLDDLPPETDTSGTLVTGDFNSYSRETPLTVFRERGYRNEVAHRHPCKPEDCDHYTYRFRGLKGSLDHALVSPGLKARVIGTATWLINADEPPALGYRGVAADRVDGPWRSSDHNPVITDLRL